ncbi:hypothetical protein LP420_37355 [Massilia sp. B-10]|nr:hypothetical protein LP420_37355 [Massilia sp. B-10]
MSTAPSLVNFNWAGINELRVITGNDFVHNDALAKQWPALGHRQHQRRRKPGTGTSATGTDRSGHRLACWRRAGSSQPNKACGGPGLLRRREEGGITGLMPPFFFGRQR